MKQCKKCLKTTDDFTKSKKNVDGLHSWCRSCVKAYDAKRHKKLYNSKIKHQKKAWKQARLYENQGKLLEYFHQHPCVDCGETNPLTLEFDHVKNKSYSIAEKLWKNWDELLKEIAKCEVRCANCHRIKTYKQLQWSLVEHPNMKLFEKFNGV